MRANHLGVLVAAGFATTTLIVTPGLFEHAHATPKLLAAVLTVVVLVAGAPRGHWQSGEGWLPWVGMAWWCWSAVGMAWSPNPGLALVQLVVGGMAVQFLWVSLRQQEPILAGTLTALGAGLGIWGMLAEGGPLGHRTFLGETLLVCLAGPLLLHRRRPRTAIAAAVPMLVCLAGFSGSGALVGALVVLVAGVYAHTGASRKVLLAGVLAALACGGIALNEADRPTVRFRQIVAAHAVHLVTERPLLGWGPGQFAVTHRLYAETDLPYVTGWQTTVRHVHCAPLEAFVDGGLVGGLLWLGMHLGVIVVALRREDARDRLRGAALAGVFAAGLFSFPYQHPATLLGWGILVAQCARRRGER